jgi:hypothetical protein
MVSEDQVTKDHKRKPYRHVVELTGYGVMLLLLVGFLLVGQFVPTPEAVLLDHLLELLALPGIGLIGLGRVLR